MGGGGPKVQTGIKAVDNTANQLLGASTAGILGNSLADVGKNIERGAGRIFNNAVGIWQPGGFNNFGNTVLQNELVAVSGGGLTDQDIQDIAGETGIERKYREGAERDAQDQVRQAAAEVAQAQAESTRQVTSTISGLVSARKRYPGRKSLLSSLSESSPSNTLLDIVKGS